MAPIRKASPQVQQPGTIGMPMQRPSATGQDALFLGNLANILQSANRLAEAEHAYLQALAIKPDFADAHYNFGNLLIRTKRWAEAEAAYRHAIAANPNLVDAHNNLGNLLHETHRLPEAEAAFRQALAIRPDLVMVHSNLGNLLQETDRLAEAEQEYLCALELQPDYPDAYNNLGNLYQKADRLQDAEAAYRRALAQRPDYADALYNLGNLLQKLKRMEESEAAYRRAIALRPTYADAQYSLGNLLLTQGRYAEAWPLHAYCYGPGINYFSNRIVRLPYPQWSGESLQGKSLLIWPEHGYGDYIQFARYIPLLKQRGVSRLTLICPPPLQALLSTLEGVDEISTEPTPAIAPDYWTFPLALPLHFGSTLETLPAPSPYLRALPERVQQWQPRLPTDGFKVGLVWQGNPAHKNDANRSLPGLATLAPLWQVPGVSFVSLQKGTTEQEAAGAPVELPITALGADITDFADTAAIVAQLDLVICVDTAVAHLAGAIGTPCWVLVPAFGTDWRWLTDRADSPWYPEHMRLFRQMQRGDWRSVIDAVVAALKHARDAGR
jgi:tetratricopeptide (TPR) repeat protein/ADP-heptose:LPS heptosyltransferase